MDDSFRKELIRLIAEAEADAVVDMDYEDQHSYLMELYIDGSVPLSDLSDQALLSQYLEGFASHEEYMEEVDDGATQIQYLPEYAAHWENLVNVNTSKEP